MIRLLRAVFVAAMLFVPLATGPSAMAQVCPTLDPTCTVDDTVHGAHQTADHAGNTVQGTADDAVSTARGTVDGLLHNGGNPPPGGGGGSDPGNGGGPGGPRNDPGGNSNGHLGAQQTAPTAAAPLTAAPGPGSVGASANDGASDPKGSGTALTMPQVAASVIGGMAVMGLLLGAIAVFLMVQDRLDRRDPKLLPVPLGSDEVLFT